MSLNPFTPPTKPAHITLDTLPQLFAHHRARFGGWSMTAGATEAPTPGDQQQGQQGGAEPPARPDGVSEQEWTALGDAGRTALTREREARQAAERALAATRARPTPPGSRSGDQGKDSAPNGGQNGGQGAHNQGTETVGKAGEIDVEAIVTRAVQAAVKPFQEREEQREADEAAGRVRDAVLDAAKLRFHDATDALASIDLTTVLDGNGQPDSAKIGTAIEDLLKRKPLLGKVIDDQRHAPDGAGATTGGSTRPLNDRVKDKLARMQERAGVKFAATE